MTAAAAYRVDTTSRLAQWRIDDLAAASYRKSDPFKIGLWNWHLSVEKSRTLIIRLYPEVTTLAKENPPIASFMIKVISLAAGERKCFVHPDVTDKQLKSSEDFVWTIEVPLSGKFIVDVEFLDIKTAPPDGGEPCSIWSGGLTCSQSNHTAIALLGRMLSEGIQTDVTINASDGSISAHRAILASRSPVIRSMFLHELKGKETAAIDISDMSIEACRALLNYMYGNVKKEEFLPHRLSLLHAADKYEISDLKDACHESLLEDIDTTNVLERLQNASVYHLPELKSSCLLYLVKFSKIYDIRDEFRSFLQCADRELIAEIFDQILGAWKGF
ncbi:BTB/POZ domain-containing protein At1g55760-like [Salvia hispanica]|uniref:BTB/POZ domain-containing protein At1g55760-like n=1 Tax=Salvia hispanica TaxID=49212 RepID=UPI0020092781|nr:BTB/POZ domain-containing protein At1g55760-like [Salvia hispanica]